MELDTKTRQDIEWKLMQLAFEFQKVDVEDAVEMLRMAWQFGPEIREHILRGNLKQAG